MPDDTTPDDGQNALVWAILNPITALSALFGAATQAFAFPWIEVVWDTIWYNAGTVFTVLSIGGNRIAGMLGVSTGVLTALTVAIGGIFVLKMLDAVAGDFLQRLREARQ